MCMYIERTRGPSPIPIGRASNIHSFPLLLASEISLPSLIKITSLHLGGGREHTNPGIFGGGEEDLLIWKTATTSSSGCRAPSDRRRDSAESVSSAAAAPGGTRATSSLLFNLASNWYFYLSIYLCMLYSFLLPYQLLAAMVPC